MTLIDEEKPGATKPKKVEVVPYDPAWPLRFEEVREHLLGILSNQDVHVEHVGSTSVNELAAKPILDIDIVLQNATTFEEVKALLEASGYYHVGDLGITGREAFKYQDKPHLMSHHLYVLSADSDEFKRHLTFRDWLRGHPEDREAYAQVKIAAAQKFPDDISAYIDAKSDVILGIYTRCGLYRPQDLSGLARSVLINRYDLPLEEIVCKQLLPGLNLCQAITSDGILSLLAWEKTDSTKTKGQCDQRKPTKTIALPIPTASGQRICKTPFGMFALFRDEREALAYLNSGIWKDAIGSEEKNG